MTSPVITTAGNSTPGRLGCVDLNMGTPTAPTWTPIQYIESYDFNPDDAVMTDATVFGDQGFSGQDKMGAAWALNLILNHMSVPNSSPPIYDTTHDYLESHAVGVFGPGNRVNLRMYDFDLNDVSGVLTPRGQAYMGFANYAWPRYGATAQADPRKITVSFLGKGKLTQIAHPYPLTPVVPTLYRADNTPYAAAGGTPFRLTGQGFTGTTAVTIAGVAATSFKVWSDTEITGVAPAHAAGSGLPIVVTNPTGASTTGSTLASYV